MLPIPLDAGSKSTPARCSSHFAPSVCAKQKPALMEEEKVVSRPVHACLGAGAGYEIILPTDKVPTAACSLHGGLQTQLAQGLDNFGRKAEAIPNKIFRSFRKFFGGR